MNNEEESHAALVQLQAYLAQRDLQENTRLPAERELCECSACPGATCARHWQSSRRTVRSGAMSARAPSSAAGRSRRPSRSPKFPRANPAGLMRARLIIEPEIAREAALHATPDDIGACAGRWRRPAQPDLASIRELRQSAAPGDRPGEPQRGSGRPLRRAQRHSPGGGLGRLR